MGKASRLKKERRDDPLWEAEQEAEQAAIAQAIRRRRTLLFIVPIAVTALAFGCYYGLESKSAAGVVGLIGAIGWLVLAASSVGATIKPSDRDSAAAIDFGTRKR